MILPSQRSLRSLRLFSSTEFLEELALKRLGDRSRLRIHLQLLVDILDVGVDSVDADEVLLGNPLIAQTFDERLDVKSV